MACEPFASLLFLKSALTHGRFDSSLCLCLCQTKHSHESRTANTSKQTKTMHTLLCQQQRRPSSRSLCDSMNPALASVCLLVQSAARVPAGSSIVRQHVGCTVRLPPLPPNHAATWCPRRPVFHKSRRPTHGHSIALRFLCFSQQL